MTAPPITDRQHAYALDIARRLHLPRRMLDDHTVKRFGKPLDRLSKQEASDLLEEIIPWEEAPAAMARAMGQVDLPGCAP